MASGYLVPQAESLCAVRPSFQRPQRTPEVQNLAPHPTSPTGPSSLAGPDGSPEPGKLPLVRRGLYSTLLILHLEEKRFACLPSVFPPEGRQSCEPQCGTPEVVLGGSTFQGGQWKGAVAGWARPPIRRVLAETSHPVPSCPVPSCPTVCPHIFSTVASVGGFSRCFVSGALCAQGLHMASRWKMRCRSQGPHGPGNVPLHAPTAVCPSHVLGVLASTPWPPPSPCQSLEDGISMRNENVPLFTAVPTAREYLLNEWKRKRRAPAL